MILTFFHKKLLSIKSNIHTPINLQLILQIVLGLYLEYVCFNIVITFVLPCNAKVLFLI